MAKNAGQTCYVQLGENSDKFIWGAHRNGCFSVQSMYMILMSIPNINHNVWLWKLKLPLKVKKFLWYLGRGVILTKDNLIRRCWKGSPKCGFCNHDEDIQHLLFDCYLARAIWRIIFIALNIERPSCHTRFLWQSRNAPTCTFSSMACIWRRRQWQQ